MKKVIAAIGLLGVFVTSYSADGMEDPGKAAEMCLGNLRRVQCLAKSKGFPQLAPHPTALLLDVIAMLPEVKRTSSSSRSDDANTLKYGLPILIHYVNCTRLLMGSKLVPKKSAIILRKINQQTKQLEQILTWDLKPIVVDDIHNMENGLRDINRDLLLRLCRFLDDTKVRNVIGMNFDHYNWTKHRSFTRARLGFREALCREYCTRNRIRTRQPDTNTTKKPTTMMSIVEYTMGLAANTGNYERRNLLDDFFEPTYRNDRHELDLTGIQILHLCFPNMTNGDAEDLVDVAQKRYTGLPSELEFIRTVYENKTVDLFFVVDFYWNTYEAEQTIHPEIIGPAGALIKLLSEDTNGRGPENAQIISNGAETELQTLQSDESISTLSDEKKDRIVIRKDQLENIKALFGSK